MIPCAPCTGGAVFFRDHPSMTPQDFIRKWKTHALTERAAAQEHFLDLCRLFDHPTPAENDPRAKRIAKAAKKLDDLRRVWLNPPDLVDVVPEVVPGYPHRILPKTAEAAAKLKTRTLTNLYNERPTWLDNAHAQLDRAVASAYGWPEDISTEDALAKLLALNLARAEKQ
jgi:hypothetical protein